MFCISLSSAPNRFVRQVLLEVDNYLRKWWPIYNGSILAHLRYSLVVWKNCRGCSIKTLRHWKFEIRSKWHFSQLRHHFDFMSFHKHTGLVKVSQIGLLYSCIYLKFCSVSRSGTKLKHRTGCSDVDADLVKRCGAGNECMLTFREIVLWFETQVEWVWWWFFYNGKSWSRIEGHISPLRHQFHSIPRHEHQNIDYCFKLMYFTGVQVGISGVPLHIQFRNLTEMSDRAFWCVWCCGKMLSSWN